MSELTLIQIERPKAHQRARMGMHLSGPMPTIRDLQHEFGLRKSAACQWHRKLVKARREFASTATHFARGGEE